MSTGNDNNNINNNPDTSTAPTAAAARRTPASATTMRHSSSPPTPATVAVSNSVGENQTSTAAAAASQQLQQRQQQPPSHDGASQGQENVEQEEEEDWRTVLEDNIAKPGREALHHFFYPPVRHRTAEEQQPQQLHHVHLSHGAGSTTADVADDMTHTHDPTSSRNHISGPAATTTTTTKTTSPSRRRSRQPLTDDAVGSGFAATSVDQQTDAKDPLESSSSPSVNNVISSDNEQHSSQPQNATSPSSPPSRNNAQQPDNTASTTTSELFDKHFYRQELEDRKFVEHIWTIYDDIIILSLFTQVGIVARLGVSTWFSFFDNVFSNNSPLFVNLPLNCLSCFIMGMLCSGERLMEIITTRFSPPQLQQQIHNESSLQNDDDDEDDDDNHGDNDEENGNIHRKGRSRLPTQDGGGATSSDDDDAGGDGCSSAGHSSDGDGLYSSPKSTTRGGLFSSNALRRRRRRRRRRLKRDKSSGAVSNNRFHSWQPPVHVNEELRDVQLLALERRIRLSKCLLLFPVKKEDVDVMEHYFQQGYKKEHHHDLGELNRSGAGEEDEYTAEHHDQDDYSMQRWRGDPGTGRLDDLALEERVVVPSVTAKLVTSVRKSVIGPASIATTNNGNPTIGSTKREASLKPAVDPLTGILPNRPIETIDSDERVDKMTNVELNQASPTGQGQQDQSGVGTLPINANAKLYGDKPTQDLNQMVNDVQANVTENISRLRRANIADGWDVGTTPEAMSDDLMLGLRDGFCGALSSFSSWNSAMVNLIRSGNVGAALVGYILGLQLPIIAYRFGQHVAVYIFIWRCRRETKRDERRGYGIRVSMNEYSEDREVHHTSGSVHGSMEMVDTNGVDNDATGANPSSNQTSPQHSMGGAAGGAYSLPADTNHVERETPSIRAVATALFIMALVTQCTSISFYTDYESQVVALSLLFSPLGVFARWRLSKYNSWRLTFPIGTFTANMLACALSGGLGRLLAGNPGERERLVLVSFINGFGGTLSSVASFIVEILAGTDPVLLRLDGVMYALWSLFGATVIGFVFSASADWADATG